MKESSKKSALKEQDGIEPPEIFSTVSIDKIVGFRKIQPSAEELVSRILNHDKVALSRAKKTDCEPNNNTNSKLTSMVFSRIG